MHRIRYTGEKLHKIDLNVSDKCIHCSQLNHDTDMHAVWHCTPVRHFWVQVTDCLFSHTWLPHPFIPPVLHLDLFVLKLHTKTSITLLTALTVAEKTILLNWKSKNTSTSQNGRIYLQNTYMFVRTCDSEQSKMSVVKKTGKN